MRRVMNMLMLSCRKATGLMEEKAMDDINSLARFQLFLHTSMCNACKLYEQQSQYLERILRKHLQEPNDNQFPEKHLPDNLKSTIIRALDRE